MENGPFISDVPIKTSIYSGFSMAMLNNQRVESPTCHPSSSPAGRDGTTRGARQSMGHLWEKGPKYVEIYCITIAGWWFQPI